MRKTNELAIKITKDRNNHNKKTMEVMNLLIIKIFNMKNALVKKRSRKENDNNKITNTKAEKIKINDKMKKKAKAISIRMKKMKTTKIRLINLMDSSMDLLIKMV